MPSMPFPVSLHQGDWSLHRKGSIDQARHNEKVKEAIKEHLADIVSELQLTGITAANLVSANGFGDGTTTIWSFSLPVPFARLGDTLASLAKAQQSIGGSRGQPDLDYSVQGVQISPELRAQQSCSFPALVTDAQAQAQKLASAAGTTLGPVVSVSEGAASVAEGSIYAVISLNPFFRGGDFSSLPAPQPCALTVQFKLLH